VVPNYQTIWYLGRPHHHGSGSSIFLHGAEKLLSDYTSSYLFIIYCHHETFQLSQFYLHSRLGDYITDSRNLLRVKDGTRRQRLLYQGKMAIVACLSKLPKTQHDPLSFSVDLTLFTVSLGHNVLD
jgi:hypothetical protein